MPVVIPVLIAGLAVIIATVYAARGQGGEMSAERADYVPLELGPVSATDVALFQPSSAMWGYDVRVTDEALQRIAGSIRDRDVRIVALEQLVTDLSRATDSVPPESGPLPRARHRRDSGTDAPPPVPGTAVPLPPLVPGTPAASGPQADASEAQATPETPVASGTPAPQAPQGPIVPEPPTVPGIPAVPKISQASGSLAAAPVPEPDPAREPEQAEDDLGHRQSPPERSDD